MSYVIMVGDDNTLYATRKERIMQRSKCVDDIWFLASPTYKNYDMSLCTVMMEYILPVSRKYKSEILTLDPDGYEDFLKYIRPVDSDLTSEAGKIELQLTFIYADMDDEGKSIQRVRKTSTCFINIIPISAWSDIIPDSALSAIDQRIIMVDSQIKAMKDTAEYLNVNKADNLKYNKDTSELQLLSGDKPIGDLVEISDTVVFDDDENHPIVPDGYNIVEF